MSNPYMPLPVTIKKITVENEARDIKTFDLKFNDKKDADKFKYTCGQFAEISILGVGEAPIGIASSPMDKDFVQFTVKKYQTGVVTSYLHDLCPGDVIGIRGPYGNGFPIKDLEGSNLLIIGGGFALTTLRSLTKYVLHKKNRERFKDIILLYGARGPGEIIYKSELDEWDKRDDINIILTVDDRCGLDWKGCVGLVPNVLKEKAPSSNNCIALVCGPFIMVKYTIPPLLDLGFVPEKIFTSLEMRMKCGIGKCGRCNIGSKYVCKDGPVFTYKELQGMPNEY
jgi:sulfhydrogenase subunit gamma (sulfur reductase)